MRPKKKVLLVDTDENRLSILCFVLKVHRYAVHGVSNSASAMVEIVDWDPELVIVSTPLPSVNLRKLFADFTKISPAMSTLLLSDKSLLLDQGYAQATLLSTVRPAELLERVKMLAARKRGPRKFPVQSVTPEAAVRRIA
jgi:DNA-binding response OmpR family regulator